MQKPKEITISRFQTLKSKAPVHIPLFNELRDIRDGKYRLEVEKCRDALKSDDKELYTVLKSKLPCVTFCGLFENGHKAEDVHHYNQLMVIDIDKLEPEKVVKIGEALKNDPYVLGLWLSPSGNGFKGLVGTDNSMEQHRETFDSLRVYFLDKYETELDGSGSDVSRLCFSSWDPDAHYNNAALPYNEILDFQPAKEKKDRPLKQVLLSKNAQATEGLNARKDRELIKKIIKYLEKNKRSITLEYENWVKVALAISYTFSYDVGEKYFLELCRMDGAQHDEGKSEELLKYCYNRRKTGTAKTISLATIIYLAKQSGFVMNAGKKKA